MTGRKLGYHPPYKKRARRENPYKARSKSLSWSPDHDKLVEECMLLWPAPVKSSYNGQCSLVSSTAISFIHKFLKWLKENNLRWDEETEVEWWKHLKGGLCGEDEMYVRRRTYEDDYQKMLKEKQSKLGLENDSPEN